MAKEIKQVEKKVQGVEQKAPDTNIKNTETIKAGSKPVILWIVIVILAILLVASIVMITLLVSREQRNPLVNDRDNVILEEEKEEDSNDTEDQQEDIKVEVGNEDENENSNASQNTDQGSQDNGGISDVIIKEGLKFELDPDLIGNITGWPTYTNAEHKYSLQYPKDLTYEETNTPNSDQTVFKSGDTVVFIVRVENGNNIDDFLANMITNQCTEFITYYDVTKNNIDYRRALEDPNQGCLDAHGIVRDNDLEAFGVDFTNIFFGISSQKLNQSQFNQVLESVKFASV